MSEQVAQPPAWLLLKLALWQLKNGVRSSLSDPKKLVPLLIVGAMISTQVLAFTSFGVRRRPTVPLDLVAFVVENRETIAAGLFLLLGFICAAIIESGFGEGFLTFPLADIDYLFPSPISRRRILAFRLASHTAKAVLQALFTATIAVAYFGARSGIRAAIPPWQGAALFVGLACLFAGYTNIALTMKLILGFGRLRTVKLVSTLLILASLGLMAWGIYCSGPGSLQSVYANPLIRTLFFPCAVAADLIIGVIARTPQLGGLVLLLLFYGLSLALVFSRNEDYYEASLVGSEFTARIRQATKAQDFNALFALQAERRRLAGKKVTHRSFPRFGRGVWSLLWAHLAAAAKRPGLNFISPVLGAAAVSIAAKIWIPPVAAAFAVGGVVAYPNLIISLSALQYHRQSLSRQGLIRSLPFPAWSVVFCEVLPRVFFSSLSGWTAGLLLLVFQMPQSEHVAPLLLFCMPLWMLALQCLNYGVALWFPDPQDKLAGMLAGLVSTGGTLVVLGVMVPILVGAFLLKMNGWAASGVFFLPAAGLNALFFWLVGRFYQRWEPGK